MKLAARIGISPTEFWEITPFELNIYAQAYWERERDRYNADNDLHVMQAYLISRWVWQKRVEIKKFLSSKEKKKQMTDDEMRRKVIALNAAFGGTVKRAGGG